jgi:long-chain acyl-CoA synthetase
VFTVSFFQNAESKLQSAQFTHQNLTAGVAAVRALMPPSALITPLDTLVSAHPLTTAFGRAIAYTAVYEGTSFATLDSTKLIRGSTLPTSPTAASFPSAPARDLADILTAKAYPIPSPTLLFLAPAHVRALTDAILHSARKSSPLFTFGLARRHKLAAIRDGFVTRDSLWDRLVFDGARVRVIGEGAGTVRAVVVANIAGEEEALDVAALTPARLALSVPFVHARAHALVAGPVFASHPLDLQAFEPLTAGAVSNEHIAPVGPPAANVEAKLVGVVEKNVADGADPKGMVMVRGPPVGKLVAVGEEGDVLAPQSPVKAAFGAGNGVDEEGWVSTGEMGCVMTNGTFKVWSRNSG